MDISSFREVKDLISSIFLCQVSCSKNNSMRYIKLGEDFDSTENLQDYMCDMFHSEKLNLDLNMRNFCDVTASSNDSMNFTELFNNIQGNFTSGGEDSVVYASLNSSETDISGSTVNSNNSDSGNDSNDDTVVFINRIETTETEIPYKYVISYTFDFDYEEDSSNSDGEFVDEGFDNNSYLDILESYNDDNEFEDDFFNSEPDICDKFSLSVNGSKNNLLDDDADNDATGDGGDDAPIGYIGNSVGLVDYDSSSGEDNSDKDNDDYVDLLPLSKDNEGMNIMCKPKSSISQVMRKGYIYYSSELRLYSGKLTHEPVEQEKKYKFVKKMFRKVFPSNKYVVNA